MSDGLVLVAGLVLAALGGEMFVQAAVGFAAWARLPARLVATTVAAFATSMPELAVSVNAALAGKPAIGVGDALGSNVANVGLVLGLALVLGGMSIERDVARRDLGVALAGPVLTLVLVLDGRLSRFDGCLLLAVFFVWLVASIRTGFRRRRPRAEARESGGLGLSLRGLGGVVALLAAGRLVAEAAKGIGGDLGMDPFVVGATLVAVGTSFPELATTLTAARRGHHEVGLGNILGSNIFNGLWIVGVVAVLEPFAVSRRELTVGIGFGILLVSGLAPGRRQRMGRSRGALLLAIYATYIAVILVVEPAG